MTRLRSRSVSQRLFALVLCALLTVPLAFAERAAASGPSVISVAGENRYETAVAASAKAYPDGADTVIIATGRNWPDALGGSALAGVLDAPILLVPGVPVPQKVLAEIERLGATSAIVLGGEGAVSPAVTGVLETELGSGNIDRIAGENRYETADKIAQRIKLELGTAFDGTAFVATGGSYADAVAAAPLAASKGWPLYLAHPHRGLSQGTKDAMTGVTDALVLGGTRAVSDAVQTELADALGEESVERLAGGTRYSTAVAIAEHGVSSAGLSWDRVGIATGQAFPDALAGGVLQGKMDSVMLLTHTASLAPETQAALSENRVAISAVTYYGGRVAISQAARCAVSEALASSPSDTSVVTFPDSSLEAAVRDALFKPTGDITTTDMEQLTEIDVDLMDVRDLTGLQYAANLTLLDLWNNQISDLSPLSGLTSLQHLDFDGNLISDLSPLSGLTNLHYLSLGLNQVSDISPLSGLTNLTSLNLSTNQLSDISPLSGLTNLESLYLSYNQVSDIAPLSGLTALRYIGLESNQISDISPLVDNAGLGAGSSVALRNNPLDLSEGSDAMNDIAALQARGVTFIFY